MYFPRLFETEETKFIPEASFYPQSFKTALISCVKFSNFIKEAFLLRFIPREKINEPDF